MTTAQDQQSRELLPCPFCGGVPETTGPWEIGVSDNYETCICCEKCGFHISSDDGFASGEKKSLAKAIDRWNRRAPAEQAARALPAGMEPVAEIVECRVMGQQTVSEIDGAWKFLPYGTKLYTAAQVLAPGCVPVDLTDAGLSAIYKRANGEDVGKAGPLTTANIFRAMRATLAAAPRPPAAPAATEPQAPTTGAGTATAGAAQAYRLLQPGVDTIQATDEVLADDVVTWKTVGRGIFAGMTYIGAMLPVRRALNSGP